MINERKKAKKIIIILTILLILLLSIIFFYPRKDKQIKMIDLTNKNVLDIEQYALDNKLVLDLKYENNEEIKKDQLISQSIKPDTIINTGDKLEVVLSSGPFDKNIYKNLKVNELGRIPVMMYHGIQNIPSSSTSYTGGNIDKDGYQRTAEAFREDLEFYYKNNYRMIRLQDYVTGVIDVPLGKSPLVLTFDDGLANNIKVTGLTDTGEIIIDPNSAVGILEEFKHKYPDYQVTATFFVNGHLFNQSQYNDKILKWLVENGYDIGNHTYGHVTLGSISEEKVSLEIGKLYEQLNKIIPNQYVEIMSLPFGSPYTIDHKNFPVIMNGKYQDFEYHNIAALRVGWDADYSPFSKSFNKQYIKRIRAYDNEGENFDIEMNFKILGSNRYISDGDKNKIVIPIIEEKNSVTTTLKVITY